MRAGSTRPSHLRHHWTFQVMSFIRLPAIIVERLPPSCAFLRPRSRNAKGRQTPAFRWDDGARRYFTAPGATVTNSSVVVLLAPEPQQARFRPAGEVLDPDHHHTECGRGGELGRIDRQRHRGAGARPYHGERTGADRIVNALNLPAFAATVPSAFSPRKSKSPVNPSNPWAA